MNATASEVQDRVEEILPLTRQFKAAAVRLRGTVPRAALDAFDPASVAEGLAGANGSFTSAVNSFMTLLVDKDTAVACAAALRKTETLVVEELAANEENRLTLATALGISEADDLVPTHP